MTGETAVFKVQELAAIALKRGTAPLRVYVGQVEAVDDFGVRLTLVDWLLREFCGNDFFVPWQSIESALIATTDQEDQLFLDDAARFQSAMDVAP